MGRAKQRAIVGLASVLACALVLQGVAAATPQRGATDVLAEIQIQLCAPADRIVRALDLHPHGKQIDVWHFDDADLTLFGRGLRLRLRVEASGASELTLKVANQDCTRLDPGFVPAGEGKCEYDVYESGAAGVVSLNRRLPAEQTRDLIAGQRPPAPALSPAQDRFLREVAGALPLPAGIRGLGPMQVQTYRAGRMHYDVDITQLPDGKRYAEISRKVPLGEATRAMGNMKSMLARAGVEMCKDQSSQIKDKLRSLAR